MKILSIGSELDRVESELFAGLASMGFEVTLICEASCLNQEKLRSSGVEIVHRRFGSRVDIKGIGAIRRLLKERRPDLVHCLTGRGLSNAIIAAIGIKVPIMAYRGTMGHLSRLDPTSYISFLNSRISAISCVSNAVRDYLLAQGVPAEKLITIYKGHDLAWYQGGTTSLEKFGIKPGSFVVGSVANMRPVKGIDLLVQAASELRDLPDLKLLLVGECRDQKIKGLVSELKLGNQVQFAGYVPQAWSVLRSCSVFVMPSRAREGLPKALIEAMSQGVAPVVTDVGGMPEIVRDGVEGIVVQPNSPAALAQALRLLYRDRSLIAKYGEAAKHRILDKFNIRNTINETAALYRRLAS